MEAIRCGKEEVGQAVRVDGEGYKECQCISEIKDPFREYKGSTVLGRKVQFHQNNLLKNSQSQGILFEPGHHDQEAEWLNGWVV